MSHRSKILPVVFLLWGWLIPNAAWGDPETTPAGGSPSSSGSEASSDNGGRSRSSDRSRSWSPCTTARAAPWTWPGWRPWCRGSAGASRRAAKARAGERRSWSSSRGSRRATRTTWGGTLGRREGLGPRFRRRRRPPGGV